MVNRKYNKELDKRLNDIFIFTKDNNDKVEYNEILELLDHEIVSKYVLSYNLKNNYCSTYTRSGLHHYTHYYTGLKLRNNL